MTKQVTQKPIDVPVDLMSLDIPQLRMELTECLDTTRRTVIRMAAIVRRLEELGEDLSDLKLSVLRYIRRIAYGQMDAEVLVKFQGSPRILRIVSNLPLPDQQKLIESESVELLTGDGGDRRKVPLLAMSGSEFRQAFSYDGIRDDAEQMSWLRNNKPSVVNHDKTRLMVDRDRGGLVFGSRFFSQAEILEALRRLNEPEKT